MRMMEKMHRKLNDSFNENLQKNFYEKFGIKIETHYAFLGDMRYHLTRVDGLNFTKEQHTWLKSFEQGYCCAMTIVGAES